MVKVLLIKLKNIGDALLLTPTIRGIKQRYPDARITAFVRSGTESILSGCTDLDEILVSAAPDSNSRAQSVVKDVSNLLRLRAQKFDFVFELSDTDRGRWLAILSGGRARLTSSHGRPMPWYFRQGFTDFNAENWHLMHRVEKDYRLVSEFLDLNSDIPGLMFNAPTGRDPLTPDAMPYVVVHPVSRWKRKAWPLDRWVSVCLSLINKGLRCVISSGPDAAETALAEDICRELGKDAVSTHGQRSWPELARLIQQAELFVGLDTAAMHLAAACQCPIVALFGPSIEQHWHPWKSPYEIVSAGGLLHQKYPDFLYDAEKRSMLDIQTDEVIAACGRMLKKTPTCP